MFTFGLLLVWQEWEDQRKWTIEELKWLFPIIEGRTFKYMFESIRIYTYKMIPFSKWSCSWIQRLWPCNSQIVYKFVNKNFNTSEKLDKAWCHRKKNEIYQLFFLFKKILNLELLSGNWRSHVSIEYLKALSNLNIFFWTLSKNILTFTAQTEYSSAQINCYSHLMYRKKFTSLFIILLIWVSCLFLFKVRETGDESLFYIFLLLHFVN